MLLRFVSICQENRWPADIKCSGLLEVQIDLVECFNVRGFFVSLNVSDIANR